MLPNGASPPLINAKRLSIGAPNRDNVVTAVDEAIRRCGKVVDGGEQSTKHIFANRLCTDVRIAVGERVALRFVPLDVGRHRTEQHGGIVIREGGIARL